MSIASKRVIAYLDDIAQEAMQGGRLPDPLEVRQAIAKFVRERTPDGPSMQFRKQARRGQMNVQGYNSMVQEIISDLNFLFAEQVDQANRLLKAVNDTEVKYGAFLHQIDTLKDLLDILLLVEPKASGYFYSIGDQFRDLSKVDQLNTTAALELGSGMVTLPISSGTRKLGLPHLAQKSNVNIQSDTEIISSGLLPGSRYGSAFDDTAQGWQHRIMTADANGWSGSIAVPVSAVMPRDDTGGSAVRPEPLTTNEIYLSRIDLEGLTGTQMQVKLLYSVDGRNYLTFPGYDWVELAGRGQSWYFTRTKIEFLKILMRKATPDDLEPNPTYIIGLKNLSIYDAGFANEGIFVSNELDPEISTDIGRIVLEVDDFVPDGTAIEYYAAPYAVSPSWQRIQPTNRVEPGASPVLDFTKGILSPRRDNRVLVTSTPTLNSNRNGIAFYDLVTLNASRIFDTVKVYRGVDGWRREVNDVEEIVTVRDNYVIFTRDDSSQQLYLEIEELVTSLTASDGTNPTVVRVKRPIFFGDPSINVKPSGTPSNQIPDYAVKQVLLLKATAPTGAGTVAITEESDTRRVVSFVPSGMTTSQVNEDDWLYVTQGSVAEFFKILVVTNDGTNDYLELEDPDRLLIDGAANWASNTLDITQSIQTPINDTFQVDASIMITASDRMLVVYRSPLNSRETPLSSSLTVKDSQGGTQYELGRDYVFDPVNKAISRRPEGRITVTGDSRLVVRADFQFKRLAHRLDTYSAWFYYEGDGEPIGFSSLSFDSTASESAWLQTSTDRSLDLTRVTVLDGLARGWRLLTVRSKPLTDTDGNVDTTSAIYKVINCTDVNGLLLFGPAHFPEHRAVRKPLRPVTLFYLQTSVGKDDRDVFAIDTNTVVLNWDPTDNRDMIYIAPGTSVVQARERFEVEYKYAGSGASVQSLLFKAILSRDEGFSADRTPVLRWYNLRLAR